MSIHIFLQNIPLIVYSKLYVTFDFVIPFYWRSLIVYVGFNHCDMITDALLSLKGINC